MGLKIAVSLELPCIERLHSCCICLGMNIPLGSGGQGFPHSSTKKEVPMTQRYLFCFLLAAGLIQAQILQNHIPVSVDPGQQGWVQVGYNYLEDTYLAVWEDYRNSTDESFSCDIYGQFISSDGNAKGHNFPICLGSSVQFWPHLDYDPELNRFLVVFEDYRNGIGDVYGAFVNGSTGRKMRTDSTEADTCFALTKNPVLGAYAPSVAFNEKEGMFLAVWSDYPFNSKKVNGQIVGRFGDFIPTDIVANITVAEEQVFSVSNADVTYIPGTNEWFVVYGLQSGEHGYACGQRVDANGVLIKPDGTEGMEMMILSAPTKNNPDMMQARVQANAENRPFWEVRRPEPQYDECLVTWGVTEDMTDYDLRGQRVAFIPDSEAVALGLHNAPVTPGRFFTVFVDSLGKASKDLKTNLVVCNAPRVQRHTEIAYSEKDNEYFVVWGDRRNVDAASEDVYGQLIAIQPDSSILFLGLDRQSTVSPKDNIPLETGVEFEGDWNIMGCAHSTHRNEFFAVYTYNPKPDSGYLSDIRGVRIGGSAPSEVRKESGLPLGFELYPNQPNPFNPETRIRYSVPAAQVTLEVFDIQGRLIRTLVHSVMSSGTHEAVWDGRDASGRPAASGLYIAVLRQGQSVAAGKMMLAR
jgi:hypothetical protein